MQASCRGSHFCLITVRNKPTLNQEISINGTVCVNKSIKMQDANYLKLITFIISKINISGPGSRLKPPSHCDISCIGFSAVYRNNAAFIKSLHYLHI